MIVDSPRLERLPTGRRLTWRTWRPGTPVDIALEEEPGRHLARVTAEHWEATEPSGLLHPVFRLQTEASSVVRVAERRLPLEGTPNFRDFGGYWTREGRQVRWGRLYRSGQLATLSEEDVERLAALGLERVCDFRQREEALREPSRLPAGVSALALAITPGSTHGFMEQLVAGNPDPEQTAEFMLEVNRDLVLGQRDPWRQVLLQLAEGESPLLVHCAVGKDRTGFAAALVLEVLGVPREIILADYLLTADYLCPDVELQRLQQRYGIDGDLIRGIRPMLEARRSYLGTALAVMDEHYGSVDHYVQDHLGLSSHLGQRLREQLLYPLA